MKEVVCSFRQKLNIGWRGTKEDDWHQYSGANDLDSGAVTAWLSVVTSTVAYVAKLTPSSYYATVS